MQNQAKASVSYVKIMHILIGLSIMLFGQFLESPRFLVEPTEKLLSMGFPQIGDSVEVFISHKGMIVSSIFIGLIYLWIFVDLVWPSFLGIIVLGISDFSSMKNVLTTCFGNPTFVFIFFLLIFCAALVKSKLAEHFARYLLTRDIVKGRPWLLTTIILITAYLTEFIAQIGSVLIVWPVLYFIFNECGYKKGDRYVSFMIANVVMMAVLSFSSDIIKGGPFYVMAGMTSFIQSNPEMNIVPIDFLSYLFFSISLSIVITCVILFLMRFVYKVNIEPLKRFDIELLKANPLPPLNFEQKMLIALFAFFGTWMLLSGLLPKGPIGDFLRSNQMGVTLMLAFVMSVITYKGKKLLDFPTIMPIFTWNLYCLFMAVYLFGGLIARPETNIVIVIESVFSNIFTGVSYTELIVIAVIIGLLQTNLMNSIVTGLILSPIFITLSFMYGYAINPLLVCFFFIVFIAVLTPAGSPYAALLFSNNDWISKKDAIHHAFLITIVCLLVVFFIGIPFAQVLF